MAYENRGDMDYPATIGPEHVLNGRHAPQIDWSRRALTRAETELGSSAFNLMASFTASMYVSLNQLVDDRLIRGLVAGHVRQ